MIFRLFEGDREVEITAIGIVHCSDEDEQPGGGGNYSNSYDTHNMRSLHQYTREALPRLDHYRNVMSVHGHMDRPTLDELHNATLSLLPEKVSQRMNSIGEPRRRDTLERFSLEGIDSKEQ